MNVQTITNTFSKDFQQFFAVLERKGRISVLISLICHCLATDQLEPPETMVNKGN